MAGAKKKATQKSKKAKTSSSAKKNRRSVAFLQKPACTSCPNAKAYMEKCGFDLRLRDIGKDRLRPEEIESLIGDRDYRQFLNTRNELYPPKNMKENPPSRAEPAKRIACGR